MKPPKCAITNLVTDRVTGNKPGHNLDISFIFFLEAQAPLGITRVKKTGRKKFQIAITCSLLLLLAP